MTRSKFNQFHSRIILLTVLAALMIAGPAYSQNAVPDRGYNTVDLSVFFGAQWYQIYQGSGGNGQHYLTTKQVFGERLTFNPLNHVGFEINWALGLNELVLSPRVRYSMPRSARGTAITPMTRCSTLRGAKH
jgi:hypothetical protein